MISEPSPTSRDDCAQRPTAIVRSDSPRQKRWRAMRWEMGLEPHAAQKNAPRVLGAGKLSCGLGFQREQEAAPPERPAWRLVPTSPPVEP
jgi:hypothetical protein